MYLGNDVTKHRTARTALRGDVYGGTFRPFVSSPLHLFNISCLFSYLFS